jgi:hypothetical protein
MLHDISIIFQSGICNPLYGDAVTVDVIKSNAWWMLPSIMVAAISSSCTSDSQLLQPLYTLC